MPDILELEKVRISTPKNEQSQERKSPPAIIVASQVSRLTKIRHDSML